LQVVPRALTQEEKLDAGKVRKLESEAIAEQERLQAWDESLLLRYSTTEDIEAARDRALRDLKIRVSILKSNRRSLRQQVENAQARVAESERLGGQPRAEDLDYIAIAKTEIDATERQIEEREAQVDAVFAEYQLDIDRFQQLQDVVALRQSMERQQD
jgi:predicted  nucleic acid-binding Zn-ribbon protein